MTLRCPFRVVCAFVILPFFFHLRHFLENIEAIGEWVVELVLQSAGLEVHALSGGDAFAEFDN